VRGSRARTFKPVVGVESPATVAAAVVAEPPGLGDAWWRDYGRLLELAAQPLDVPDRPQPGDGPFDAPKRTWKLGVEGAGLHPLIVPVDGMTITASGGHLLIEQREAAGEALAALFR
jgi:hypothetical protein